MSASVDRGAAFLDAQTARYIRENRITDSQIRNWTPPEVETAIKCPLEYLQSVIDLLHGRVLVGDTMPWKKTHANFRFRPGEVTLWHGINGHGKSAVTTQVALWLALQGKTSCLASFEMMPERTLKRLTTQAAGNPSPTDDFVINLFMAIARKILIYDHRGRVDKSLLYQAIRYCAAEFGATHFFIDSLMKCCPREDDMGAQSDFINSLCDLAHETQNHIHIIHHVRKGEDEKKPPGKFDAKGSGAITDQVDNVIAVWRNKAKERERDECLRVGAALTDETPDFLLICDKQRNGEWEGNWALWGDPKTAHFRETAQTPWQRGYDIPVQVEPGANG